MSEPASVVAPDTVTSPSTAVSASGAAVTVPLTRACAPNPTAPDFTSSGAFTAPSKTTFAPAAASIATAPPSVVPTSLAIMCVP